MMDYALEQHFVKHARADLCMTLPVTAKPQLQSESQRAFRSLAAARCLGIVTRGLDDRVTKDILSPG